MKIAVIPNDTKDIGLSQTRELCAILAKGGAVVCMDEKYKESGIAANFFGKDLYDYADAAVVLGGDGTILLSAEPCARRGIPVMGINLGRIGFMTEVEPGDMSVAASRLISGDYAVEERMMMDISICSCDEVKTYVALNDCVVAKSDAQMIMTGIFADNEEITEYIADGVILSTPTGSTGYSLSAGGPVADPGTEVFLVTPICAHTLMARPALVAADKEISVRLFEGASSRATVTIDGIECGYLSCGDRVVIKKSELSLKLIKFGKQSFYDILTSKLR